MTPRWRTTLRVRGLLHSLLESFVPLGVLVQLVDSVRAHTDPELVTLYKLSQRGTVGGLSLELVQQLVDDEPFDTPGDSGLIYAVEAALLGARGRLDGDPKAAECIESIDGVLLRLGATKAASGRAASTADTWHGQREKWRALIEHIRERRAAVLADEGLLCAAAISTELHDLLGWIDALIAFMAPLHGAPLPATTGGGCCSGVPARAATTGGGTDQTGPRLSTFVYGRRFYELMQAYRHSPLEDLVGTTAAFEAVRTAIVEAVGVRGIGGGNASGAGGST